MMMMMLVTTTATETTASMPPTASTAATRTIVTRRRRRRRSVSTSLLLFSLAAAVSISIVSLSVADAFSIRQLTRRLSRSSKGSPTTGGTSSPGGGLESSEQFARHNNNNNVESWSKSAERRSSPLQVRRRVKAVLEKARTRTGIDNSSTIASSVAEAASIGGLSIGDSDLVIKVERKNGEASSPSPSVDGDRNGKSDPTSPSNGATAPNTGNDAAATTVAGTDSENEVVVRQPGSPESRPLDAIQGGFPAANKFCDPLPFKLPKLTAEQKRSLRAGERIQEQSRMGREGSGFVVLDVNVPPYVVWECLLDFEAYPETIPTVREMQLYTSEKLNIGYVNEKPVLPGTGRETRHYGTPSVTRALFILSKFRLNIAAIHRYTPHPLGDYMEFTLDKSCTNMVLKGAKGIWYTEENPDGREGYTRVYLLCEVQISRALPSFIVDYAANRAMPRATTWLKPQVEAAGDLWLKRRPTRSQ